jgi:hypothetical protein
MYGDPMKPMSSHKLAKLLLKTKDAPLTAIVVREGELGSGNTLRVILTTEVPIEIESLAEEGNQMTDELEPDFAATDDDVIAIFDEMNPPVSFDSDPDFEDD